MSHRDGYIVPSKVTDFPIGHVTFQVRETLQDGTTFALVAGDAAKAKDRRPAFTGHVGPQMAAELRALADKLDKIRDRQLMGG